jgi:hypothetical protein
MCCSYLDFELGAARGLTMHNHASGSLQRRQDSVSKLRKTLFTVDDAYASADIP